MSTKVCPDCLYAPSLDQRDQVQEGRCEPCRTAARRQRDRRPRGGGWSE